jgi:hypothetical protein
MRLHWFSDIFTAHLSQKTAPSPNIKENNPPTTDGGVEAIYPQHSP